MSTFKLFSGTANPEFAKKVGDYLGMSVSDATLNKFSDGEISVQITESVRGQDVYIIQPRRLAKLVDESKKNIHRLALKEFLIYGLKYVFPVEPGPVVR